MSVSVNAKQYDDIETFTYRASSGSMTMESGLSNERFDDELLDLDQLLDRRRDVAYLLQSTISVTGNVAHQQTDDDDASGTAQVLLKSQEGFVFGTADPGLGITSGTDDTFDVIHPPVSVGASTDSAGETLETFTADEWEIPDNEFDARDTIHWEAQLNSENASADPATMWCEITGQLVFGIVSE